MEFRQSLPSIRICFKGQTKNKLTVQQVKGYLASDFEFFSSIFTLSHLGKKFLDPIYPIKLIKSLIKSDFMIILESKTLESKVKFIKSIREVYFNQV